MDNQMTDNKEVPIQEVSVSETLDTDSEKAIESAPEIEQLNKQISELNDKYLRLAAELENTRRRAALDAESRARNRAISVAEKVLPVMDAVDAALKHSPTDSGIQSMARALESAFAQIGITRIESIGEPLNPMFHNAIQVIECADKQPNTVVEEMQSGYMFGDTVLRTAMVIVAK